MERLDILGEGPERPRLEALVKRYELEKRVFFHGYQKDPTIFYRDADVLVQPSRWEGFGNVIVEAMSYGCQVIVNRGAGAPTEIIEDGEYRFLYEQGDIGGLQDALAACLRQPISTMKLYRRASRFRPDRAAAEYQALFENILK